MHTGKTIEEYVDQHPIWSAELKILQQIMDNTELIPKIKWGMPVYTIDSKNVVGITGFKDFFGLWFYQGCFLTDPDNILVNAQEGKTKAMRHIYLRSHKDINKAQIAKYVKEAIANEHAGMRLTPQKVNRSMPPLLGSTLSNDTKLSAAYDKLTPGRQNECKEYISSAKREATKLSRIEKLRPLIMKGLGPADKYRS